MESMDRIKELIESAEGIQAEVANKRDELDALINELQSLCESLDDGVEYLGDGIGCLCDGIDAISEGRVRAKAEDCPDCWLWWHIKEQNYCAACGRGRSRATRAGDRPVATISKEGP